MYKLLGLAGLFLLFSFTADPVKMNMKDVLASAQKDEQYTLNNQTLTFANSLNYRLPLLQKLDFRVGSDDYVFGQNQYDIGFSFNTLRQIKRVKEYQRAQVSVFEAQNGMYLQRSLLDRYECLHDLYFNKQLIKQYQSLDTLLNQKNTVLKEQILRGLDTKIKEVIDNETDRNKALKAIKSYDREWTTRYQTLQQLTKQKDLEIDFKKFIDYTKIESIISSLSPTSEGNNAELKVRQKQVDLSKKELEIELAENFKIFNSFQFGLQEKSKSELWENPFFRLTLSLPLLGNTRFKKNELLLEIKDYENRAQLFKTNLQLTTQTELISIKKMIEEHKSFLAQQEKSLIQLILSNRKITAEMTASELLDLKIIQRKAQIDILKSSFSLTQAYISLLNNAGILSNPPMRNYLSQDIEGF
jgi:hypothetical protein